MSDDPKCANCRYAVNMGNWYACRRFPPVWRGNPDAGVWGYDFPTTVGNAVCGEWSAALAGEKP